MFKDAVAFNSALFILNSDAAPGMQQSVNDLTSMFHGATNFNQNLNPWTVNDVTNFTVSI
jgi:hypothetical protein